MQKVGKEMATYLGDFQFGVGISGGVEAVLHAVGRFVKARWSSTNLSMLFVDFKNAFNMADRGKMLQEVRLRSQVGVKLLGGAVSMDARFIEDFANMRVSKSIELMSALEQLNDPQYELVLLRVCMGLKAYVQFDAALRKALHNVATSESPGFGALNGDLQLCRFDQKAFSLELIVLNGCGFAGFHSFYRHLCELPSEQQQYHLGDQF
ncbi:hypothetical protein POM88_007788 [Heracleum sosnowskyi]|uniref:Reverse transcriptase domain-containing protein n=1 Tax=Heracleum sosnowskyi TaxID=360622 RepID=A0AAD8J523_9APIA|nr:hypothetical protein POM88_007788 [Heracleum sosnowskyi]